MPPPLLQTYNAPSGPIAKPFGPPPSSATTVTAPEVLTQLTVPRATSVSNTEPSAMATGPSGKSSPFAAGMNSMLDVVMGAICRVFIA